MADYTPLLTRAVTGQDEAARQGIYARAREALERQLRGFEPRLTEEQIGAELVGLNTAIETVEAATRAAQEPALQEPALQEPALQEPALQEPAAQEPVPQVAVAEEAPEATPPAEETPAPVDTSAQETSAQETSAQETSAEAPSLTIQASAPPVEADAPETGAAETSESTPAPLAAPEPEADEPLPPAEPPPEPTPDTGLAGPVEDEVLKAANTDEVSAPALVEPVMPPVRPRMPLRDEAQKSHKPLVMAVGAAMIVILGMGALALTRRSSPDPLRNQPGQTQDSASVDLNKTEGRLAAEPPARPAEPAPAPAQTPSSPNAGTTGTQTPLATSTRAFMVLESPGNAPSQFEGRALWSFEPDPATKGEKALRTIIAFPGSDVTIDLSLSRNKDAALEASHLLMAIFDVPKGFEPVREMSPIEWRERESQAGSVLRGSVVPVQDNIFMVTLEKGGLESNNALLKTQKWMVFEFRLANGRRGAVLIEKGTAGEKAVDEALKLWK